MHVLEAKLLPALPFYCRRNYNENTCIGMNEKWSLAINSPETYLTRCLIEPFRRDDFHFRVMTSLLCGVSKREEENVEKQWTRRDLHFQTTSRSSRANIWLIYISISSKTSFSFPFARCKRNRAMHHRQKHLWDAFACSSFFLLRAHKKWFLRLYGGINALFFIVSFYDLLSGFYIRCLRFLLANFIEERKIENTKGC